MTDQSSAAMDPERIFLADSMANRMNAARNPETPPSMLRLLVRSAYLPDASAYLPAAEEAAANPALPASDIANAVRKAMRTNHEVMVAALAANPSLPKRLIPKIIRRRDQRCLARLAEHPDISLSTLTTIYETSMASDDPDNWRGSVLIDIAKHPACNVELAAAVFENAGSDMSPGLMTRCMEHQDLPSELVETIFENQQKLAERYARPTCHAEGMAKQHATDLGKLIAAHPNTPLALLTMLAMHPDRRISDVALKQMGERQRDEL